MFQTTDLTKTYGDVTLFRDVSWTIQSTDHVGLVGPNGAGKTTLLRILLGEESPDDGAVQVPKRATLGYLPQQTRALDDVEPIEHVVRARQDLLDLDDELRQIEEALAGATGEHAERLAARHADLSERYHMLDGPTLRARAEEILTGLGFSRDKMTQPMRTLSGGWGMRAHLARLLLLRPDLLLLDEPTNHLDLHSLEWLETFLQSYRGAWVVVSHDRYFLNRMVTSIAELRPEGLFHFPGTYDDYLQARAEWDEQLAKEAQSRARRAAELQGFIDRFRAKASKARQAQSRVKQLSRLQKEQEKLAPLAPQSRPARRQIALSLPEPPRSGEQVASLVDVRKAYGDNVVYQSLCLDVWRSEKLALVGLNGAGKSTLLRILAGVLPTEGGEIRLGHNVQAYYFAQHQTEALSPTRTVLQELRTVMPEAPESQVRGLLGAFLFPADAVDKRIEVLSGGEKSRVALAKMLASPKNLLLLDEPTNHLDLDSRAVLEQALSDFPGSIVLISHDRYFINRVATKVVEVRSGGALEHYPGDYDYYVWKRDQQRAQAQSGTDSAQTAEPSKPVKAKSAATVARETRKAERRQAGQRAKQVQQIEQTIQAHERRMGEIDDLLCDASVFADHERASELAAERERLEAELTELYEKWEAVAE